MGVATGTMTNPDNFIVDELLAGGDYKFLQKCEKRISEMWSGGTAVLFVSHSIDEVKRLCDHAILLNKGQAVMQGNAIEVCSAYMSK